MNFTVKSITKTTYGFLLKLVHIISVDTELGTIDSKTTKYVFVTTTTLVEGASVDINLANWTEYVQEFAHPTTGEIINLKYLRPKA